MIKRTVYVISFIILISSALAADRNYYFDSSASINGDGSQSSPFNELGDVNWDAVHNEIIGGNDVYLLLKRGEVFLVPDNWAGWRFKAGGTQDNRIYVKGYGTGNMPIIDGRGGQRGIYLSGSDYGRNSGFVTIDGIEIRNGFDAIEGPEITNLVVKNCKFHDFLLRCVTVGSDAVIGGAPGEGNEMYNCGRGTGGCDVCISDHDVVVSYNNLYATKSNGDEGDRGIDGIAAACEGQTQSRCHDILIEYNEIHDHNDNYNGDYADHGHNGKGEDGIDLKNAYDVTVRYNHIYNHFYQSGITVQMDSHDVDIYGNVLHDSYWPNIYIMDGVDAQQPRGTSVRNINVWGNLIFDGESDGIRVAAQSGSNPDPPKDVNIFNNVIAGNAKGDVADERTGVMVYSGCTGTVIKNNIFYKNRPDKTDYRQVYVSDPSTTTLANNMYYWPGHTSIVRWGSVDKTISELKALGQEQGGSDKDPIFVNAANHDYRLADNSPCIGTGLILAPEFEKILHPSTVWTDTPPDFIPADQNDFGQWEIGAYVYASGATPTYECNDGLDNDGDGQKDLSDSGCSSGNDNDESDCGDGVCEGGEACDACTSDCGNCNPAKTYTVLKTDHPPTINGNINEFKNANPIILTTSRGTHGIYKFLWDDEYLYIAAEVSDDKLDAQYTLYDSNLWEDDSLEMIFDTFHDKGAIKNDDYKFFVNVNNAKTDSERYDMSWDSGMISVVDAAGTINNDIDTDSGYKIEARIPWSNWATPADGDVWGANLVLNDKTATDSINAIWSGSSVNDLDDSVNIIFSPELVTPASDCGNADKDSDGVVDINELAVFINEWKSGTVGISTLIDAIGKWKDGC